MHDIKNSFGAYESAHGKNLREAHVVITMHMTAEDAFEVAEDIPHATCPRRIIAKCARELTPSTLTAIEQNVAMSRNLNQGT